MARYQNILETIGNTPVVKLNKLAPAGVNVYVKVEAFNPMGSVKDRLALAIIEDAERSGALKPGQTVIEATSGNTGIGLAMVCAQKGYPLVVTMAESFSVERRKLLRFLGAKVVLTPAAEKGSGMLAKAVELANTHGWFLCRQFENPANADVHSRTTAREIIDDFADQRLDYFVTGFGTGGTLKGVARALKLARPGTRIIAAEPDNSPMLGSGVPQPRDATGATAGSHPRFRPHLMQGWAPDFISKLTEDAVAAGMIDEIVPVAGADALRLSRELARQEGIFAGTSGGATLAAALEIAARAPRGSTIVCMLPDTGERYLSTPLFEGISEEMTAEEWAVSRSSPLCRFDAPAPAPAPAAAQPAPVLDPAAVRLVAEIVDLEPVVMYALEWCEFCWSVRKLFKQLGIAYRSVDVDSVKYQEEDLGGKIRAVLADRTGAKTLPQVFVGGAHIGGATDVFDAWRNGSLQKRLDDAGIIYDREFKVDPYTLLPKWLQPAQERLNVAGKRQSEDDRVLMTVNETSQLARGRACYDRHEWNDAFEALSLAEKAAPLDADDLHRLAWSAGLSARDEEMLAIQERVYHARLAANEDLVAARAAFWLGFRLLARGEPARASGWLGRSQRLVELHAADCVEQGYLLLPAGQRHLNLGELAQAGECAMAALEFGERFQEPDLIAFARNMHGRALLAQGQVDRGLAQLDEAMVAATAGELTPVVTGIVYCSSIASCHRVFALDRVREWTAALSTWVAAHPQLGIFSGHCLVHRAEVHEMNGLWPEAVDEARRAVARCVRNIEREAAGRAHYQQAEIHRLRGEFEIADAEYLEASRAGFEPQPGLALLLLAQGDEAAAASASRRVIGAARDALARLRFLPAHVEIMLAVGDLEAARAASEELQQMAAKLGTDVLNAIAAHAAGSLALAQGDAQAVLEPARRSFRIWQRMGAPYLAARLRVLLARACLALGDAEGAQLELQCAREVFEKLGALPDLAALDAWAAKSAPAAAGALSERELQVLRLLATGKTNKAMARELALSEKTIDRHLSNIFGKIGVATRAAATAFAYERKLI